ncbi:MAG: hypothetical protein HY513_00095 [Candidatus Aenigmarchaeota archaeon]|nr:hypothetical protein [Candidatus Aenigmarchaeota archaeon]
MKKIILISVFVLLIAGFGAAQITPSGASLKVDLAKYDPAPAEAGNLATVWIKAENIGLDAAPNASFELVPKYPFTIVDNDAKQTYGRIEGKSSVQLEWRLRVDENAPKDKYSFDVVYSIGGISTNKKSFNLSVVQSKSIYELDALYVGMEPAAYPGGTSTLSVDIANIASGTAYFVIAQAETDIATIDRNEIFVGTLEPNDFDTSDFDLKIKDDVKPGTYPVKILTKYKDDKNIEHENTNTVNVNVVSALQALPPKKFDTTSLAVDLILLILILQFVVRPIVRHYKKKK